MRHMMWEVLTLISSPQDSSLEKRSISDDPAEVFLGDLELEALVVVGLSASAACRQGTLPGLWRFHGHWDT